VTARVLRVKVWGDSAGLGTLRHHRSIDGGIVTQRARGQTG
jgi:hypothetical protein